MKIIYDENMQKFPIKSWCDNPESGAVKQAVNLSNLPFIHKHVALMPDTHQGYGMPIGGVIGTKGVVIPNAVGVDIGCGMCAVKTPWTTKRIDNDTLRVIIKKIRKVVPVGFKRHSHPESSSLIPQMPSFDGSIVSKHWNTALTSLGTLGGGNHFIEIQVDEEGFVWIMLHSGSRNLGKQVADYYNKRAKVRNKIEHSSVPQNFDLAFLPIESDDGKKYLEEMSFCMDYALANRKLMMERITDVFNKTIMFRAINLRDMININHNYARMENHFGTNVMIHRKGATSAKKGELGIIPGSQGTSSYIVRGLGNKESFTSCSHGAGRVMGRNEAKKTLSLENEKKILDDQGILHSISNVKDLDEAPSAYKDIDIVMEEQKDLIEVVQKLSPLAVIKG